MAPKHLEVLHLQRLAGNQAVSGLLTGQIQVQRARGATRADPAAPERTSVDLTGHYEAIDAGTGNRITVQINQAGRHVEGWWEQLKGMGWGEEQQLIQHRVIGDLASDHDGSVSFDYRRLNPVGGPVSTGLITGWMEGAEINFQMTEDRWSHQFSRLSTAPRLSQEAVEAMPGELRELVRAAETAPLDTAELALIDVAADEITTAVAAYFAETRENVGREARASAINKVVREKMGVFPEAQKPLAIRTLRGKLISTDLKSASVTRPVWDWLQVIVSVDATWTPDVQQKLNLRPAGLTAKSPQHDYRWRFSLLGASAKFIVGVSGYLGAIIVEKLAPDTWETHYFTVVGGLSVGAQIGFKLKTKVKDLMRILRSAAGGAGTWNEFHTPLPWTSGNFAGAYAIGQGTLGVGVGAGASYSKGRIFFYGDGTYPTLDAPADEWTFGIFKLIKEGQILAGAEASFGGQVGYMWGGNEEALNAQQKQDAILAQSAPQSVTESHFIVNDPSLTVLGRQAIRAMCALHRAELENPATLVSVDGFASPTGTHERNKQLSELRARNALQAMRDALGPAFRVPRPQTIARGHGDAPALSAGVPRGTETAVWRRVDIAINGQVVLRLN